MLLFLIELPFLLLRFPTSPPHQVLHLQIKHHDDDAAATLITLLYSSPDTSRTPASSAYSYSHSSPQVDSLDPPQNLDPESTQYTSENTTCIRHFLGSTADFQYGTQNSPQKMLDITAVFKQVTQEHDSMKSF
jgi:hypothetical protein